MGGPHGHKLHFHGHSPIHRAPAHLKILALVGFVLVVVATPREWFPVYAGYLAVIAVVVAIAQGAADLPPQADGRRAAVRRLRAAAAVRRAGTADRGARADGERVAGCSAAWGLLAKGTLGVLASLTLAATTEPQELLAGLERLRLPQLLVQIMSFMVRYLDVVTTEMHRMKIARESRGFTARNPRHWPVLARSAGALFIRSYERGERVHLAMLSRGYTGTDAPAVSSQ